MGFLDKLFGRKEDEADFKSTSAEQAIGREEEEIPVAAPRVPSSSGEKLFAMNAKRAPNGQTIVLVVSGRLDAMSTSEFDKGCDKLISKGEKDFLLELSGMEFIASTGLRSLMSLSMRLRAEQGRLAFCNLPESVDSVFQLAGLKKMFPIYPTLKDALAEL